jgi:polyhydroxyalkanoate synthase subunit PhaC
MLIVPAPIKTSTIWDLAPGASAVGCLLSAGLQVYLVQWKSPERRDACLGLEEYADRTLSECSDAILEATGERKLLLAGHSLGGTLAAIYCSLYPGRVRGLIELEGPMAFGAGRLESVLAATLPGAASSLGAGNVPGSFLDWASLCADPLTFGAEPWNDWLESSRSPRDLRRHLQVRRWTLDERPMARRLFDEVKEGLYRDNRFAQRRLRIGARIADPRAIDMPVLGVFDPSSRIVPPASIEAYRSHTRSKDAQLLDYRGDTGVMMQHVGALIGRNAHSALWPRILSWIQQHAVRA